MINALLPGTDSEGILGQSRPIIVRILQQDKVIELMYAYST